MTIPQTSMKKAYKSANVIVNNHTKTAPTNSAEFAFPGLRTPGSCGASWVEGSTTERKQRGTGGVKKKRLQGPCDPVIRRVMNVPWKLEYRNQTTGTTCDLYTTDHHNSLLQAHMANKQVSARQPNLTSISIRGFVSTPRQIQKKF